MNGRVDPFGNTKGIDFILIFLRRAGRFPIVSDWIVGDDYILQDREGTIIGAHSHESVDFIERYAEEKSKRIPADCKWNVLYVPYIHNIKSRTGEWDMEGKQVFGDGQFWLNGPHEISVQSGWIKVRKCCPCNELEVGEV
jgi:hypothetical protein